MQIDLESYYKKYGPMVYRRCLKMLETEARAAEAMQDTFVQLLVHQESLRGDAPSSLLYKIATRVCLNILRTERRRSAEAIPASDEGILEKVAALTDSAGDSRFMARDFLSRIFHGVEESTALMAVLFFFDEMTLEEIAKEVKMSVSGVRKRLRKFNAVAKGLQEVV